MYVHMGAWCHRDQKRAADTGPGVTGRYDLPCMWVLGTEPKSCARTSPVNHSAISPEPLNY